MSLRQKRLMFRAMSHAFLAGPQALTVVVGALVGDPDMVFLSSLIVTVYLLTIRRNPLPGLLERLFLKTHRCSWCGHVIPLSGPWQCTVCRYLPRERHAFATCPGCRNAWEFIECPYDGTRILL